VVATIAIGIWPDPIINACQQEAGLFTGLT
jgi:hypothetical protein